jgi:thiol-disulfide isomerase/thioredoxin
VEKKDNQWIIVKGHVKNIPADTLLLTDAFNPEIIYDSAVYKNDTFSFELRQDRFEPFIASIRFHNKDNNKSDILIYQNPFLSTSEKKYGFASFVLDKGKANISGEFVHRPRIEVDKLKLNVEGNLQNEPYFKTQMVDFGWINDEDSVRRKKIIKNYESYIRQYPYSYYFIKILYDFRFRYSESELKGMLSLFKSDEAVNSVMRKFDVYFSQMSSPGKALPNFIFKDSVGRPVPIINQQNKLNMIIFWASWCGPCRKEIPDLKKIYEKFSMLGLNMTSVSIDDSENAWSKALRQENMKWQQLIINESQKEELQNSFRFSTIPLMVFTDARGFEVARFADYDPKNFDEYVKILDEGLAVKAP